MASNAKKPKEKKVVKQYRNLLYMTPKDITAKDITVVLQQEEGLNVELWEAMNVLEIALSNGNTIDFEPMKLDFQESSDLDYIRNRDIHTMFSVVICEEDFQKANIYFVRIVEKLEGFFCADSEDFMPVYVGNN